MPLFAENARPYVYFIERTNAAAVPENSPLRHLFGELQNGVVAFLNVYAPNKSAMPVGACSMS